MKKRQTNAYQGFQKPGGRLSEKTLADIVVHSSEHELGQLYACHMFDKAHLVMLAEEKLIPCQDAALMLASLREMEASGVEKVRLEVGGGIHSGEYYLINQLTEEIGGRIHLGRSSGDIDKVADRIKMRDELLEVMEAVNGLRGVLLKMADEHKKTVMPGHTHGQQAQPTTLGHQLLAWAVVLSRDFERLQAVYSRINRSPAGAAIMTGSEFALNRHRTAALLGFDRPCENTLDAIHSSDDLLEVFTVVALLHGSLARWADDLIFWSANEVRLMALPDRFCGTSSILVQKKNPYALEHVRGAAAETMGGLMTGFYGEKGTTGMSIFSRNRYTKQMLWQSFDYVIRDLGWFSELIPDLKVNREWMEQSAGEHWAQATDIAGALVREKGHSWRTAHQITGILIRLCLEQGIGPEAVTTSLLDEAAQAYLGAPVGLSAASLHKALDPVAFVEKRVLYGGPAPVETHRRIDECRAALTRDRRTVTKIRRRCKAAADKLEAAIDLLIQNFGRKSGPDMG